MKVELQLLARPNALQFNALRVPLACHAHSKIAAPRLTCCCLAQGQRTAAQMQRLEALQSKQQAVLQRKTEEANAARRRLKVRTADSWAFSSLMDSKHWPLPLLRSPAQLTSSRQLASVGTPHTAHAHPVLPAHGPVVGQRSCLHGIPMPGHSAGILPQSSVAQEMTEVHSQAAQERRRNMPPPARGGQVSLPHTLQCSGYQQALPAFQCLLFKLLGPALNARSAPEAAWQGNAA